MEKAQNKSRLKNPVKQKSETGKIDATYPEKSGDFVVIRHGATKNNEDGLNRGMLNLELSDQGKKEAHDIAPKVAEKGLTGLISSPLFRAQQTAEIISDKTGIPVIETNKGLLPWAIGDLQGKSIKETLPILHEYMDNPEKELPGGESFNQFKERTLRGLKQIYKDYPNKKLGLVTHHRVERLIEAHANEKKGRGNFAVETQKEKGIEPANFIEHKWKNLFPHNGKGGPGAYKGMTPKPLKLPQNVPKQLKVNYSNVIGVVKKGMNLGTLD